LQKKKKRKITPGKGFTHRKGRFQARGLPEKNSAGSVYKRGRRPSHARPGGGKPKNKRKKNEKEKRRLPLTMHNPDTKKKREVTLGRR